MVLRRLDDERWKSCFKRVEANAGGPLNLTVDARGGLRAMADGDGRYMLTLAEELAALKIVEPLDPAAIIDGHSTACAGL